MILESLSRKFHPAGFDQPEGSRQNYVKPRKELQEVFYQWVNDMHQHRSWEELYNKARELIEPIGEIPYREANSLLVDFKPKTEWQEKTGLFISACYIQSSEQIIVFDMDAPNIDCIGYMFGKDSVLVNNGNVGVCFGEKSTGVIVNNNETENWFGERSSGIILNNSKTGDDCGASSSGILINGGNARDKFGDCSLGIVISIQEPRRFGYLKCAKSILKPSDYNRTSGLGQCLEELVETTRSIKDEESAKRFLHRYGPEPRKRIESDIEDVLREGGSEVYE